MTRNSSNAGRPDSGRAEWLLALVFVCLEAGIVTAGYFYYVNYEKNCRSQVERQLSVIAELKVGELRQWRKERLGDGATLFKNAAFSSPVRRAIEKQVDAEAQRQLQAWFEKYQATYQYDLVCLVDGQGVTRISVPPDRAPLSSTLSRRIPEVLRSGQLTFQDFYRNEHDQRVYLAVLVPILDESDAGHPLGVLVLRIDPATYLYPFILRWPTPSLTAETLLVRREGNEVVFLNELRFRKNTALTLRAPLDQEALPAARAALGQEGVMEGIDYRGVPVVAVLRAIPDSPWSLVARMDAAEAYAPTREQLKLVVLLISTLLLGAGAGVGLVWRQRRVRFYRKRAEAAEVLRESEERFRMMVENVKDYAIIMLDAGGHVVSWNAGAERIKGYQADEIVGQHFSRFYSKEDVESGKPERELAVATAEGRFEEEGWRVRKDGSRFIANVVVTALRDDVGQLRGFARVTRDITERRRAEENIRRMAMVVRDSNDAVMIQDFEGRITAWNRGAELMYGYSEEEALRMNKGRLMAPGEVEKQKDFTRRLVADETITSFETKRVTKDGRVLDIWVTMTELVDDAGKLIGIASTERDITERKREEKNLRRLVTVVRDSNDAITIQDFEGRITAWNHGAELMFGYSEQEALKMKIWQLAPPNKAAEQRDFNRRLFAGETITSFETQRLTKDGRLLDVWLTATKLVDDAGKVIGIAATERDITARKRAEEIIRQLNSELEQRVRDRTAELEAANQELEAFSYSVSHDLRAPLRAMDGFSQALLEDYAGSLNATGRDYLGRVRAAAERMAQLIDDLLQLSRVTRPELRRERVDLSALARTVVLELHKAQPNRSVEFTIADGLVVEGDARLLRVVLENLLGNAWKFTGKTPHAKIEFGAASAEKQPSAGAGGTEPRGERVYFVGDNGAGFDMAYVGKLFGAFQRLHPTAEFPGTGIGLATVQRIIHRHGGRVWAEGAVGRGATFYFTLQATKGES